MSSLMRAMEKSEAWDSVAMIKFELPWCPPAVTSIAIDRPQRFQKCPQGGIIGLMSKKVIGLMSKKALP